MAKINTFDDDAIRQIAESVRRLEAKARNTDKRFAELRARQTEPSGHEIRTGFTTTNDANPTYPDGGCQFVVQLEDWEHPLSVGSCPELEATKWAKVYVIGRTYDGTHLPEDTEVIVLRIAGRKGNQYYLIPLAVPVLGYGTLDSQMCRDDTEGTVLVEGWYDSTTADCIGEKFAMKNSRLKREGSAGANVVFTRNVNFDKNAASAITGQPEGWEILNVEYSEVWATESYTMDDCTPTANQLKLNLCTITDCAPTRTVPIGSYTEYELVTN